MLIVNLILYTLSFILIWYGSGLIVSSISKFSRRLKLSQFTFSFIFLGLLTSIPEFSVGLQAVADNKPEIFVGNLLGGIIIIFLVIIPILAVFGNGINLRHEMTDNTQLATLAVLMAPSLLMLDNKVTNSEGILLIVIYAFLLFVVQSKKGIFDRSNQHLLDIKAYSYKDILKVVIGIGIVFVASSLIVDKTIFFAEYFNISAFYIGLLVISIGTNLPELSIAVRAVVNGKKDIAMGDYMGSAAANILCFGILTILHDGPIIIVSNFLITFLFIALSLGLFYFFFYTKKAISRSNGIFLLVLYVLFVFFELLR